MSCSTFMTNTNQSPKNCVIQFLWLISSTCMSMKAEKIRKWNWSIRYANYFNRNQIQQGHQKKRPWMLDMMVYYWIKYVAYKTTPLWKMRVADSKRWRQNLTELNIELTNDNYYIITIRGHPIKLYKKLWL